MKRHAFLVLFAVVSAVALIRCGGGGDGGNGPAPWLRQIGGTTAGGDYTDEEGEDIVADASGSVYMVGGTSGTLPGSPAMNPGRGNDLFLVKYNGAGDNVWTRQMGSSENDIAWSAALDASGNIYVVGYTSGTLPGSPTVNQGGTDLFLVKFNSSGDNVWTRQMGSSGYDEAFGVAVDASGNVYVAGHTYYGTLPGSPTENRGGADLFLVKFNSSGDNVWTRQMGSSGYDFVHGVAVDATGNIYVTGQTDGNLPGSPTMNQGLDDLFLVKFDSSGDNVWTRQLGSSRFDRAFGVAVDASGNVYVAGETDGTLPGSLTTNQGDYDLFLVKYNSSGEQVWTRQMGSPGSDSAFGVAVDASGNVYVAGETDGTLPGSPTNNQGGYDLFLIKFNSSGDNIWTRQKGSSNNDAGVGIAVDHSGMVYLSGGTMGSLDGNARVGGDVDVVVLKYLPDGTGP